MTPLPAASSPGWSGVWVEVRGSNWRSVGVLRLDFRLHALYTLSTLPAERGLDCDFAEFQRLFDGQKSTRSRVHFKLNLFAGAKWGTGRCRTVAADGNCATFASCLAW